MKGAPPSYDSVKGRIAEEIRLMKAMGFAAEDAKKAHDTIYQEENFEAYAAKHGLRVQERGFFSAKDMPAELRQSPGRGKPAFQSPCRTISPPFSRRPGPTT